MAAPTTMKGLVLGTDNSITLKTTLPYPEATLGSVTIRVLMTGVNPNAVRSIRGQAGSHAFNLPRPLVPGTGAIARVVATGTDATTLKPGQLVLVDGFVRGRDNPGTQILWGSSDGMAPASKKLHADVWRDGVLAEYCRAPLENTYALDETILCGDVSAAGLGYSVPDLAHIWRHSIGYAGLRRMGVQAGETVLITPATGLCTGAAVAVALAMGATVIAASRSTEGLAKLQALYPAIRTAVVAGDVKADSAAIAAAAGGRPIDALLEMSPPAATGTLTLNACLLAVKQYGRACLMGGRSDPSIPIPFPMLVYKNITLCGGFMYERDDLRALIRLVESGRLKLGKENGYEFAGPYSLEDWDKASEESVEDTSFGKMVLIAP